MNLERYWAGLSEKMKARLILALILILSAVLMTLASYSESPAVGELSNLSNFLNQNETLGIQIVYGFRFISIAGSIIFLSFVYSWSKKMLGVWWGLMPVILLAFSPTFIAYGHYFRADILIYISISAFIYFLSDLITGLRSYLARASYSHILINLIGIALIILFVLTQFSKLVFGFSDFLNSLQIFISREILPSAILITIAGSFALKNIILKIPKAKTELWNYILINTNEFLLIFFALFIGASLSDEGSRYISFITPFIYILTTSGIKNWIKINSKTSKVKSFLASSLVVLVVISAFSIYPHYLSYLNNSLLRKEAALNIQAQNDFGVDLKSLNDWLGKNKNGSGKIGLDYYGDINPAIYLGDQYIPWRSAYTMPEEIKIDYLGISAKKIFEALKTENLEDKYLWLGNLSEPNVKIGNIWIYKLD